MKFNIYFIIYFITCIGYCHKNVIVTRQFGNIELKSSTPYKTEDISKNLIIGHYLELISQRMSFAGNILIVLEDSSSNEFSIWDTRHQKNIGESNYDLTIFIRSKIDVTKCLTLFEHTLTNFERLKKHKSKYSEWYFGKPSSLSLEIQRTKVYRPENVTELKEIKFFTYYYQSGYFHLVAKNNCETKELMKFDELKQLSEVKPYVICLFTGNENVSIIDSSCNYNHDLQKYETKESKIDLVISSLDNSSIFRPYSIKLIGENNIIFETFWAERISLYSLSKKIYIEDFEDLIKD